MDRPSSTPALPPAFAEDQANLPARSRVLIVDDDIAVRLRVRDLLELADGHVVFEAIDGASGLAAARSCSPDLILLDIMMPGMDGLEVCQRLRQDPTTREIPILILSGAEESEALLAALDAGAEDFLPKPFAPEELRAKARNITRLNRYRSLARKRRQLQWIIDQSVEALVTLDADGRLLSANACARALFRFEEGNAADVLTALTEHYRPDPPDALERVRAGTWPGGQPFALNRPADRLLEARWFQVDLFTDPVDPAGTRLLKFSDRTSQVRDTLETRSFQHHIAHKLRTPLNGLGGMLDMLAESPAIARDAECAELLGLARESAQRLEQTVTGILKYHAALFPRLASGSGAPSPGTAASSLASLLRLAAEDAGLQPAQLRLIGNSASLIRGETMGPLRSACTEVLDNYRKFSEAARHGVEVQILVLDDHRLRLRFTAPGPALPPEALASLGRPYWQLEGRFTGEVPGVGLGLATARLLLGALGGELRFASNSAPAGVLTEMDLPRHAHEPAP